MVGSYNVKSEAILRFYKWLYYRNIEDPKKRNELSKLEGKPECIIGIRLLKRKEISCYKPSDLWTQEDDKLFLKWVTNKRDRCYHTVARDLSARPHEILGIKIRDVVFKNANNYQYAEIQNWKSTAPINSIYPIRKRMAVRASKPAHVATIEDRQRMLTLP